MAEEMDGAVRIAWEAEEYRSIRVYAPWRGREELTEFAQTVADLALLNRSLASLRSALRAEVGGTFDLRPGGADRSEAEAHVRISLHPPRGEPNPDE